MLKAIQQRVYSSPTVTTVTEKPEYPRFSSISRTPRETLRLEDGALNTTLLVINANYLLMNNVYQARTYASGDEESIVELLRLVFPDWLHRESPIDFWKWKYLSPPLGSAVAVATHGGKIVGTSHDVVVRIKIGDEVYTGTYGDDAATHPDHQGKGVYLLAKQVVDRECIRLGAVMDYSIPIHPAFARSRDPGQVFLPQIITHVIRVRDPETYLKAKGVSYPRLKGWAFRAVGSIPGLRSVRSVGVKSGSNLVVEVTDRFDDRVNHLWKIVCAQSQLRPS